MNWLDIVLIIVVGASVLGGLVKGFARMMVGFIAAIVAVICGMWFYGTAGYYLLPYVSHKGIANLLGFLAIFFGIVLLGAVAGKLLGLIFKWTGLSWLDRLMGVGFGVLRGLLLAVAFVLALMAFSPTKPPDSVVGSRFAPYVIDAAHICAAVAPREVKEGVKESYEKVRRAWSELIEKGTSKAGGETL